MAGSGLATPTTWESTTHATGVPSPTPTRQTAVRRSTPSIWPDAPRHDADGHPPPVQLGQRVARRRDRVAPEPGRACRPEDHRGFRDVRPDDA